MEEHLWVEKYRPKKVDECILPDRLKKTFKKYVENKTIPNLMLTGPAGSGKTTLAKALCEEIGASYLFVNSSEDRGIDVLRTKIRNYASTLSIMGGRKVVILDEGDGITPEAQKGFRGAIEEFSASCSFIITCNYKSKLIEALHSRMAVIDFTLQADERPRMASQFLKRMEVILNTEGVTYDRAVLFKIVERYFPDYRRLLNELQHYGSLGTIDSGTLSQISSVKKFDELVQYLNQKDFTAMRKWVAHNFDVDASRVFRSVYDALAKVMKPESVPQAVVIIAKYQYQSAFCADQEINLVACFTELMVSCEFQ